MNITPDMVSVRSAAKEHGVSPSTLYAAIEARKLRHGKLGDRLFVKPEHVATYVATLKPYGEKRRAS